MIRSHDVFLKQNLLRSYRSLLLRPSSFFLKLTGEIDGVRTHQSVTAFPLSFLFLSTAQLFAHHPICQSSSRCCCGFSPWAKQQFSDTSKMGLRRFFCFFVFKPRFYPQQVILMWLSADKVVIDPTSFGVFHVVLLLFYGVLHSLRCYGELILIE